MGQYVHIYLQEHNENKIHFTLWLDQGFPEFLDQW